MSAESLKTVERAIIILKLFSRAVPGMTVAEVVRRSKMPRAVVQRILVTLEDGGFLERCADSLRFRIGFAACEVGALYLNANPLIRVSDEILNDLAKATGFPVYLGTQIGADVSILALHEGRSSIRFLWSPGDRLPIATTALGKAMLMHMGADTLRELLGDGALPGLSAQSIQTRRQLDIQLDEHRARGWIPAFEESLPGIHALGSAVLSQSGNPIAGISVSFLRDDRDPGQIDSISAAVTHAARRISQRTQAVAAFRSRPASEKSNTPPSTERVSDAA